MDTSTILSLASITLTGVISISTIYLNYRTARFTAAAAAQLKSAELHMPQIYEALKGLTEAYSHIFYGEIEYVDRKFAPPEECKAFISAALTLSALIHDSDIQAKLVALTRGHICEGSISRKDSLAFEEVMSMISAYLDKST